MDGRKEGQENPLPVVKSSQQQTQRPQGKMPFMEKMSRFNWIISLYSEFFSLS